MTSPNAPRFPSFDPADYPINRKMREQQVAALDLSLKQAETALAFLQARLEADRKLGHGLTAAQTAAEAMDLWRSYWQDMLADYSTQSTALATNTADAVERSIASVSDVGQTLQRMLTPR